MCRQGSNSQKKKNVNNGSLLFLSIHPAAAACSEGILTAKLQGLGGINVWESSGSCADGFCTISSHFLLSVRCRMSITGKSLPLSATEERGTREQQREEKKEEEEDVSQLCDVHDASFLSHQTDERAVGAMTLGAVHK